MGIREAYYATCDTCGAIHATGPHATVSAAETAATNAGWLIKPGEPWGDRIHCPDCRHRTATTPAAKGTT